MDADAVDGEELARSLRDLEGVNRWLGGTRVLLESLGPLLEREIGRELRLLDVATGAADIPLALAHWARERRIALRIVATDTHPATLAVARKRVAGESSIEVQRADALRLPYADGSFDFAMCNTALHHFDPVDAKRVLAELWRVSRRGVVVTDLTRSYLGMAGVRLLAGTLWRGHPVTRHDGPVSIRASYIPLELRAMAREAGLGEPTMRSWLLYNRMAMVARR